MYILIFVIVLVALIVVHEVGHLIAAKIAGMRVDEFGLGYPPRAWKIGKWGGTEYTLNWLPFGGFVKIFGEDQEQKAGAESRNADPSSFGGRPRWAQAFVLVAGVLMNLLFAYALIVGALVSGTPRALAENELAIALDRELAIANVLPGSPAAAAGLKAGDIILSAEDGHYLFSGLDPAEFSAFVDRGGGNATVALDVRHADGSEKTLFARPVAGLVPSDPARYALGIQVAPIGVVPLSLGAALKEGAALTASTVAVVARGLWLFFAGAATLSADLSQVAGPIGIAGVVGSASAQGLGDLLSIVAVISVNLALINLIPVPALDGGRLLFVIIEGITRRPIKPAIARSVNAVGFSLLVLLMLVVTAHDIAKLVG